MVSIILATVFPSCPESCSLCARGGASLIGTFPRGERFPTLFYPSGVSVDYAKFQEVVTPRREHLCNKSRGSDMSDTPLAKVPCSNCRGKDSKVCDPWMSVVTN
jgi:hypothetical protein